MKQIYKTAIVILCALIMVKPAAVNAQSSSSAASGYSWEFGAGLGFTNYYGDLSNYRILNLKDLYKVYKFADLNPRYLHTPSFSLLAQKKLNRSIGVLIQANVLQFEMSDRYRRKNGSVDGEALNFDRSLNFRTNLQDLGVALTFNSNNGGLFKEEATFYPSFYMGMGISHFSVKGDLYDGNNAPYNYASPGYINDGDYETDLRKLNTETSENYNNVVPFLNLGLALNFKMTDFLKLVVQSDIKYSGSDYLDDVSKTYKTNYPSAEAAYAAKPGFNLVDPVSRKRGDNNGVNDIYINNRVVVFYTLHPKKKKTPFKAPVVYSILRADTSRIPSYRRSVPRDTAVRDTLSVAKRSTARKDTVMVKDSSRNLSKIMAADTAFKSGIDQKLTAIQDELQSIKTVMRNQAIIPRYRYLQYQLDSIGRLSNAVGSKRNVTPTDKLQQRVFALQQDSLRNEMQTLLWISQYPAKGVDSAALNFNPSDQPVFNHQEAAPVIIYDTAIAGVRSATDLRTFATGNRIYIDSVRSDTGLLRQREPAYSFRDYTDSINRTTGPVAGAVVDDEISQLKSQERYQSDSAYRKRIDSLERRLKSYERTTARANSKSQDSIEKINRNRVAIMQAKIDSLERMDAGKVRDTVLADKVEDKAVLVADTVATKQLQNRLRSNADSLAMAQQSLKASRDSAAYYRRTLYAMDLNEEDTVVEKRKWYQKILPKSRKEKEAEKASTEADNLKTQEAYYDSQTKKMSDDIERLQRDNRNLQNDYDRIARRSDNNTRYTSRTPVVVQGGGDDYNDRESRRLRSDIAELKAMLAASTAISTGTTLATRGNRAKDTARTVVVQQPVASGQDSAQLAALRGDLASLRKEIDSMRRYPVKAPVTAAPPVAVNNNAPKPAAFDPSSFPVISVYFAMGSSTLAAAQSDKISPMVVVGQRNKNSSILLTGFTDPVGNAAVNRSIAIKRMNHVKSLLINKYRLSPSQVIIGEPEIPTSGKKANPLDRRVDLQLQ